MKKMIVVMGMILMSSPLFAGQKEGNGGGVWACKKWNYHKGYYDYTMIEFVDLYEGREEFHLNILQRPSKNHHAIVEEIKGHLLEVNKEFGKRLGQYIDDIVSSTTFTNAELTIIDDALYRIQPPESLCRDAMVTYVQLANFTHYGKTLIQKTFWDDEKFSELGRAALIIHEALYKYARENKGDTNSVRTREAVAHIFSDMEVQDLHKKLLDLELLNSKPIDPPPTDPEKCKEGEERTTTTGAVFTCDTSHSALGEAWRDPDGLIWGDIVKKTDGTVHNMNHNDATSYCSSIGARLPSKEEFTRLREYMGDRSGTYGGYSPQVLPNLSSYWFWSSSVVPNDAGSAHYFNGSSGNIFYDYRNSSIAVRCVVAR